MDKTKSFKHSLVNFITAPLNLKGILKRSSLQLSKFKDMKWSCGDISK